MNFFEQQDRARTRTGLLVLLYLLAVLALVVATCILVGVVFGITQMPPSAVEPGVESVAASPLLNGLQALPPQTIAGIFALISSIVLIAGVYKLQQLSSGGVAVAEALGGRLLNVNTRDSNEKKLLNVVEEMAIAAGVPVPPVYLLDEASINAFAAGTTPQNAAIGITRGAIAQLDRDELQGVIAHEFSHIFNGDMRLNMRLMGMLYGILVIGTIGYYLLRASSRGAHIRTRSNNNSALPFIALGGGLMIIGYAGTFFGNLIKSAVSRQREYLADASAVQFTRNPAGIANALKKIGGFSYGSRIEHPGGAQASHMFFGQALSFHLNGLFATHPPLQERIARLDKNWEFEKEAAGLGQSPGEGMAAASAVESGAAGTISTSAVSAVAGLSSTALYENISNFTGEVTPAQCQIARIMLDSLPGPVIEAAHESYGARALVYCLLLDRNPSIREQQLKILAKRCDSVVFAMLQNLQALLQNQDSHFLDVLDLALPALKQLRGEQLSEFDETLEQLIHADNKIELLEWSLYNIISLNLKPQKTPLVALQSVASTKILGRPLGVVLSVVAHAGIYESLYESTSAKADDKELAVRECFSAAARELGLAHLPVTERSAITVDRFTHALGLLNSLRPLQKPRVLKALAVAITHDQLIRPLELQLLRAIALSLHCPMPILAARS